LGVKRLKVIVIGGGAAGYFGAIACAKEYPHTQVTLLEAGKPLAKVRVSGGGRCNVTHACFDANLLVQNYPRGGTALKGAFSRFQPQHTVTWFQSRGVQLKTEADGRMFPITDDSATIVQCLEESAAASGVDVRTRALVNSVIRQPVHARSAFATDSDSDEWEFVVQLQSGEFLIGDRLLLATGSNPLGYAIAHSLGHEIIDPVPSLFTFNVPDPRLMGLAGVSVELAKIKISDAKLEQSGALLITHWGLSGPAVLKLSAWGARVLHDRDYASNIQVNWLPAFSPEEVRSQLQAAKSSQGQKIIHSNCPLAVPKRLWQSLLTAIGVDATKRWADLSKIHLNHLVTELTQGSYAIAGKGVFKEEFVTCGGVNLKEINFKTMESRWCSGLYFAGEILDIDGITGGFNFQSAWTTGWLAGQAMGQIC
jgi:predicted Rossmann fold flavoprotein